jgi:hypothetical protein
LLCKPTITEPTKSLQRPERQLADGVLAKPPPLVSEFYVSVIGRR